VAGGGEGLVYGHQELTAHPWVGLGGRRDGRRWGSHGGTEELVGGASRRGGWPSSGLIAAAGRGEAVGVVGLGRERTEVEARWRQELTGEEEIDGEVVPVEVRPRGVAWEHQ
jgi:hypothetical protein